MCKIRTIKPPCIPCPARPCLNTAYPHVFATTDVAFDIPWLSAHFEGDADVLVDGGEELHSCHKDYRDRCGRLETRDG